MLNGALLFSGAVALILSIIVIYSNYRSSDNRWLGAFIFSGFLWLGANYLANNATSNNLDLIFSRLTLVGASLIPLTYLMFCYSFTGKLVKLGKLKFLLFCLPVILLLASTPTKLNIESVNGATSIQTGFAYYLLLVIIVLYFAQGIRLLIYSYKNSQELKKQQLYYILLGTLLTAVPGIILNGILPLVGISRAAYFGSTVVIFFSVFTSIAIIKHRLFDIRLIIARSLGYVLSLVSMGTIFILFTYLFNRFSTNLDTIRLMDACLAIITALTLPFLKKFFDKLSNSIFYRDAYDSQAFFDGFNQVLVSNYDLESILRKTLDIILKNLKTTYCLFIVSGDGDTPLRIIGTKGHPNLVEEDIKSMQRLVRDTNRKLILTSLLEDKYDESKKVLSQNNIAVIANLDKSSREGGLGSLVLGPKKSGNLYSSQDLKVIGIVTNELVVAIQNALNIEEIKNFNITLQQKVDEATHKLRNANEKLKALDETKDDFISMASHQLRTPLTSVKGYISMVIEGDAGKISEPQKKMLNQAFFSSQRMVYLISDLLNVSRLKTGKFVIEPSPVNLAQVIEQELSQLGETAKTKNLKLTYDKPKNFPTLMLDETKTRQVIMNFVDNAVYYTPNDGQVNVRLIDNPSTVELRVEDNGIGVPKAEQHHLFTKFYRAGNARKARPDGTGLGLFMAKKVVIAEGGSIIFESQEGKGSTFGFVFSKTKLAPKAENTDKSKETSKT